MLEGSIQKTTRAGSQRETIRFTFWRCFMPIRHSRGIALRSNRPGLLPLGAQDAKYVEMNPKERWPQRGALGIPGSMRESAQSQRPDRSQKVFHHRLLGALAFLVPLLACAQTQAETQTFEKYWYQGKAEITSYHLEQARYGEVHPGHSVLVYVTEDFSRSKQVKLDDPRKAGDDAVKILKLNATKKFNTGIYPYSMMASVFSPIDAVADPFAIKVSTSSQEWCGHTWVQLNRAGEGYQGELRSYFESEGDEVLQLPGVQLEDQLWNLIRLAPETLPTGEVTLLPGTFYERLRHADWQPKRAQATLQPSTGKPGQMTYTLTYPSLGRTLAIHFNKAFPHEIEGWEETSASGFGPGAKTLTTRATRNKRILSDYWRRHSLEDLPLRQQLGLE